MAKQPKPKPREMAAKLLTLLQRHADPKKAASYQRYFKEPVEFLGIDSPTSKQIQRDLHDEIGDTWTLRDAIAFCNVLMCEPHLEPRGIGFQTVARYVDEASPEFLRTVRKWLERSCGNWALVDNLAPSVLSPFLDQNRGLIREIVEWTSSPNQWVRRGATVAFVPLARKGKHLPTAYRIATRLCGDHEDLMHKAVGWMLREAGKTDMDRLETFLLKHGPKIPRTTVRYAIERFPAAKRKQLLAATRA